MSSTREPCSLQLLGAGVCFVRLPRQIAEEAACVDGSLIDFNVTKTSGASESLEEIRPHARARASSD